MSFWSFPRGCRWRRWVFDAHLYAGLAAGALLMVTGLSGALSAYAPELEGGASPARGRVAGAPPAEETAARLLAERPGMRLQDIRFDRYGNASVFHLQEAGGEGLRGRDLHVMVDPATGRVLREADRRAGVWRWLRELHHDLLAGKTGRKANGVAAGVLLLLSATGLVIWWPGPVLWRKRIGVSKGTGWKRTVWDLHSAAGFWSCAGLAPGLLFLTGFLMWWSRVAAKRLRRGEGPAAEGRRRVAAAVALLFCAGLAEGQSRPLKEQPRWIANFGGDFSDEESGTSLSVMANFVSRRFDYKANGDVSSFGGSASFDVALYQRLKGGLRLFVEGNNLTNRDRVRDENLAAGGAQWRREAFGRTVLGDCRSVSRRERRQNGRGPAGGGRRGA